MSEPLQDAKVIPCKSTSWFGADIIIERDEDHPGYVRLEIDDMPARGRVYLSPDEQQQLAAALQPAAPGVTVSEYEPDWNAIDRAANGDLDVQRLFRHPQTRDQASRLHDEKRTAALMKHVTESGFTIVRSDNRTRRAGAENESPSFG